ncbi:putative permease component of sugar ABC transporter [Methylorubrum extorquens]|uniref:Putative permease component of sugar ABC transporter n=1 Tax=Methylorubrum extorquens TaxID=408 RepID=A0A2N9AU69_METEX|nr:ABC transporter permease [Methylorubrum zatmanii]ARO55503.1 ABC transporter permease [Methylorubrum zatmanii]KQP97099.1 ABC transporter permease [Methylobacterium sp. Leaf121]SOR30877.1 putative permease component of sugar ABC transporter [Methylorubrum extorquens]
MAADTTAPALPLVESAVSGPDHPPASLQARAWLARRAEALAIPVGAVIAGFLLFSLFLLALGKSPLAFLDLVWRGGFGSPFALQNSLQRAAPLLLAALCVALPARLGLVVIGGEGAIVLGGVAAAAAAQPLQGSPPMLAVPLMALAAAAAGAAWIGAVGALRAYRGVNETIASLLMSYIAIALSNHLIEGLLRDAGSLNKPSTWPIGEAFAVGPMPGLEVHWGLGIGILACLAAYGLTERTTIGFAARIAGGNVRAAQIQGLPVGRLVVGFTALGGACAALAGFFEVAAVHGNANASLNAGFGYTGILVAFLARHNPLAILPVAFLLGGIEASNGLIQRRMQLPDATVLVLEGLLFLVVLVSETLYGRFKLFSPHLWAEKRGAVS